MTLRREAAPTLVALDALIDEVLLRTLEPTMKALDHLFEAARSADHTKASPTV